jgi:hypothetical protein
MEAKQICRKCEKPKSRNSFESRNLKTNKTIHRTVCHSCRVGKNQKINMTHYLDKCKVNGRRRANRIKSDSKRSDTKHNRQNNLDLPFIQEMISKPCTYCERHDLKIMTLDRIDNLIGHVKTNIVPSCIRCNLIRSTMPYNAWIVISKYVHKANDLGLFKNWEGPFS